MVVSVLFDLDSPPDFGNSATRVAMMPRSARRTAYRERPPTWNRTARSPWFLVAKSRRPLQHEQFTSRSAR
jgi:hypothetical protein